MRITSNEIKKIRFVLNKFISENATSTIYLHGSRLYDNLKGGDIDLFWIITKDRYDNIAQKKHYIMASLKEQLEDQKIDLTIIRDSETTSNSFFINSDKKKL